MLKRIVLTIAEIFFSPILAIYKCIVDCWEHQQPVLIQIFDKEGALKEGTLTIGKLNSCLFIGVSPTSLARLKASLAEPNRFLSKDEMTTLPGGKIRKICVKHGVLNLAVEDRILRSLK